MRDAGWLRPTCPSSSIARVRAAAFDSGEWSLIASTSWSPDPKDGVQGGERILVDHRHAAAADPGQLALAHRSSARCRPPRRIEPPRARAGRAAGCISARAVIVLPLPDSPTSASRSPRAERESDVVHERRRRASERSSIPSPSTASAGGSSSVRAAAVTSTRSRRRLQRAGEDVQQQQDEHDRERPGTRRSRTRSRCSCIPAGGSSPRTPSAAAPRGRRS